MKSNRTLSELVFPLLITLIPSALYSIALSTWGNMDDKWKYAFYIALVYIISAAIVSIVYFLAQKVLRRIKYKKYEGVWIQYIPKFSRRIAICTLKYDGNEFHFDGINYGNTREEHVSFTSYKFIEDTRHSFFYITSAHKIGELEYDFRGFGAIDIRDRGSAGSYEGDGYFFDVSSARGNTQEMALQEYQIKKYDKSLYTNLHKKKPKGRIEKMSREEIYNDVKKHIQDLFGNGSSKDKYHSAFSHSDRNRFRRH